MMTLISRLESLGYAIHLDGDDLVCRWSGTEKPERNLVSPLLAELRGSKVEAMAWLKANRDAPCSSVDLPANVTDWPWEWQETYEERAAIMIVDGGLTPQEAEHRAADIVRTAYKRLSSNSAASSG